MGSLASENQPLANLTELRKRHREQGRLLREAEQRAGLSAGDKHRESMLSRSREANRQNAEIGPPPARNDARWKHYQFNLFAYLTECFPHSTGLKPFSLDHKRIIERLQQVILEGGLELEIVFRGWAKSTIVENSAPWATGYGHRKFFLPIGADQEAAKSALNSIQTEFETNDHLMEIFPAACHCARALEGVPQRAGKQTVGGQLTYIDWTNDRCVLPTVAGFEGSGAIIWPKGITANIRGLRFKRPDGSQARPDFVMIDDPQTDESALSPSQVNKRLAKLNKTILRLGGHDKPIACVVNATIIEPDDMIDQLSNSKVYPAWRTNKVPMLKSFSTAHDTWLGKYAEIRTTHNPDDDDDKARAANEATEFYLSNRDELDGGAVASWEHCFGEGEHSAVQHAYNMLIDMTYDAFMAECQNSPTRETTGIEILTPDEMCRKQSAYAINKFPNECTTLTTFVDVHPSILYWQVWAWEPAFTGYCINYGTFPDQRRKYFAHHSLAHSLKNLFPNRDMEATVTAALSALLYGYEEGNWAGLLQREWLSHAGVPLKIAQAGIDANGEASDAVKKFIRQSPLASILFPSFGKGIGAKQKPISQWQGYKGRGVGPEWIPTKPKPGEPAGVLHDSNWWLTRFHRGLALPEGSQGALYLYKTNPPDHRRICDHWNSGKPHEVAVGGRIVYEWTEKPGTDNHDRDVAVGNMIAASRAGISSTKSKSLAAKLAPRVSFAQARSRKAG